MISNQEKDHKNMKITKMKIIIDKEIEEDNSKDIKMMTIMNNLQEEDNINNMMKPSQEKIIKKDSKSMKMMIIMNSLIEEEETTIIKEEAEIKADIKKEIISKSPLQEGHQEEIKND